MKMPEFAEGWWAHLSSHDSADVVMGTKPDHFRYGPEPDDVPLPEGSNELLSDLWGHLPESERQLIVQGLLITPPTQDSYVEIGELTVWSDAGVTLSGEGAPTMYAYMTDLLKTPGRKDSPWHYLEKAYEDA